MRVERARVRIPALRSLCRGVRTYFVSTNLNPALRERLISLRPSTRVCFFNHVSRLSTAFPNCSNREVSLI